MITTNEPISLPSGAANSDAAPLPDTCERSVNAGWRFYRCAEDELLAADDPAFDDSAWDDVCLPHTPRIEKYNEPHPWQGICWYRTRIEWNPRWNGKRVSLRFGAGMQIADVWVDGDFAYHHLGGYLPFTVDLSDAGDRAAVTVSVRLDNRDNEIVPPGKPTKDLDFNYPGGLYRGATLIVTNTVHVSDPIVADTVAGGGVFVQYRDVSAARATVAVQTDVVNEDAELARNVTVRQQIVDRERGGIVAEALCEPVMIPSGGHHAVPLALTVEAPRLWHPDHPHLYTLVTTVYRDGAQVDRVETRIGIRSFTLGNRVLVNGEEIRIAGTNRHQEYPLIEYAVSPNAGRRDAQRIKDGGFNHVRLAHYPQDPAFLDACDELGLLVQAPIPGWQIFHFNNSFVESSYQNIRDLIRRDRNHPSVVFWEPNLNETWGTHLDWCRTAHEIAHEEYPGPECYTFGDDYPEGWVPGWDVKAFVREYGDFGFGGNESTSRCLRGDGETAMLQQAWNFQWCHNDHWSRFADPAKAFQGDATWVMFDYNRGYYWKPCMSGMMDIFRLPKYVYRFFQSQRDPRALRDDAESGPMAFIASDWKEREGAGKVVVFSNCEEIELFLNGISLDRRKPDSGPDSKYSDWDANIAATIGNQYDNTGGNPYDGGNCVHLDHPPFTFANVAYSPGELRAVGYLDGVVAVEDVVRTPGTPQSLELSFDLQRVELAADGADAVFVRAAIRDANGTVVPLDALPSIAFEVSGPARLIGTDPVHVEAGIASVLLQATTQAGEITVSVKADGLVGDTHTLVSEPVARPICAR
jgi:beta-galactosidase